MVTTGNFERNETRNLLFSHKILTNCTLSVDKCFPDKKKSEKLKKPGEIITLSEKVRKIGKLLL